MKRNGFTLVEMMIALAIFGMLTAAGVVLLSVVARTQTISDRLLGEVGEIRRAGALLTADLALATPRTYRDDLGWAHLAFSGGAGEGPLMLAFVRASWDDGDGAEPRRVGYRLAEGRLERLSFDHVDGSAAGRAITLLDEVSAVRLRYRDREGEWHTRWDPSDPRRLPVAVELITDSAAHGLIRQLFLVGPPS